MTQQTLSLKMLRQRKMLLVLPLIVLPFLTILFWVLGGGRVDSVNGHVNQSKGLNTKLPDAKLKSDRGLNKMSYYDKAASDSNRIRQQMKTDPYYHRPPNSDTAGLHFSASRSAIWRSTSDDQTSRLIGSKSATREDQVYQKLAQLQKAINKPIPPAGASDDPALSYSTTPTRPEHIFHEETEDPELKQMSGLLEKIMDIQHPDRIKQQIVPQVNDSARFRAIPALIDGKQKITQGTVVRMKLLDTVTVNGQLIPKGQLLFGSGTLYNQRMALSIKVIRMGYTILPVDLTVFDMTDGLEGICVPEAVTGDAIRDGATNGLQGMELMSFDPSVGTQLAGAGINAAKGLFSKKVKRIKGKLKDGHLLLLRDNQRMKELRNKR